MTFAVYDPENHEMGIADDLGSLQQLAKDLARRHGAAWYSIDNAETAEPWGRLLVHDHRSWHIVSRDQSVLIGTGHMII